MIYEPIAKLLERFAIPSGTHSIPPSAADYRDDAARCRGVASECLHRPTADALREMAAEYEAAADRLDSAARAKRNATELTPSLSAAP